MLEQDSDFDTVMDSVQTYEYDENQSVILHQIDLDADRSPDQETVYEYTAISWVIFWQ
ncbi:hypothetical protein KO507_10550 [Gilvimarinus agarilyticus]|uniref:hypothetical protein n=1 Tax=Gilvimarinus sp. 2_MG-2023 TaxID=3062666 RepID=UPI001C08D431|nr:hypothetical protein [Gilvimarinus sp. 2_MG-2023]MBU2886202.1 hypothetical protein [Gilvimarinus agarilyticus]MDO6570890.1 hypothetical protein [Gilvimarinus sp. 2_MG-2023]